MRPRPPMWLEMNQSSLTGGKFHEYAHRYLQFRGEHLQNSIEVDNTEACIKNRLHADTSQPTTKSGDKERASSRTQLCRELNLQDWAVG